VSERSLEVTEENIERLARLMVPKARLVAYDETLFDPLPPEVLDRVVASVVYQVILDMLIGVNDPALFDRWEREL
jgi:hypothetical protein